MANYHIFHTPLFDEQFEKCPLFEQKWIDRIEEQLSEKGPLVGKPLGNSFFREKKLGGKRLYFLVYVELKIILIIAFDDKKTQPETITKIRENIAGYKDYVERRIREDNLL